MRLLKTHSHISQRRGYEADKERQGKRERKEAYQEYEKNFLDPQQLEPRVGNTLTRISGQFQGGIVD